MTNIEADKSAAGNQAEFKADERTLPNLPASVRPGEIYEEFSQLVLWPPQPEYQIPDDEDLVD